MSRPRGSGQFGADVIVGSAEYAKRWREKNKEKHELAQARYRAKQKELILASKVALADGISVEEALVEVRGKLENLESIRRELVISGRTDSVEVVEDSPREVEFIREDADAYGISYETAELILDKVLPNITRSAFEEASLCAKEGRTFNIAPFLPSAKRFTPPEETS